jgi:hypothetical protein
LIFQEDSLVEDDPEKQKGDPHDDSVDMPKPAVEAQENCIHRNEQEFPNPELFPINLDRRTGNRVHLPAPAFQDDEGEEGIENIETDDENEKKEQTGTIPVDIPPPFLVAFPAQELSSPPEGIIAQEGGGLPPSVFGALPFHFLPGEISFLKKPAPVILRFECRITTKFPPILFGRKGQGLKRNVEGEGKSWLFWL